MSYLLNVIYGCLLLMASPWLLWRYLRWGKNRRGWLQKLFGLVPRRESIQPCVWFHAVSVGEVNLLAQIVSELKQQRPDIETVISTTTETGYDLALQKYPDDLVFFFPMDFSWAIRNVLFRIRPNLIVLAELEVWPNLIRCAHSFSQSQAKLASPSRVLNMGEAFDVAAVTEVERDAKTDSEILASELGIVDTKAVMPCGIPIAIANGRLSESSFRGYRRFSWLFENTFKRLQLVLTQNETYASRFKSLGCSANRVAVTGSVKFDGVRTDRDNHETRRLAELAGVGPKDKVFLAGSTQLEEDILAASVYRELRERHDCLRLILAPRHPERCGQLIRALKELGLPFLLRSELKMGGHLAIDKRSVLVIDVIGELGAWWGVADAAYIGGSMGRREGQNMIEPAAYGVPVSFGPNTANFKEIVDELLDSKAAVVVRDRGELSQFVEQVVVDLLSSREMGARAQNVVLQHCGAAQRSVERLLDLVPDRGETGRRDAA